jgi:hypothetical protein
LDLENQTKKQIQDPEIHLLSLTFLFYDKKNEKLKEKLEEGLIIKM